MLHAYELGFGIAKVGSGDVQTVITGFRIACKLIWGLLASVGMEQLIWF